VFAFKLVFLELTSEPSMRPSAYLDFNVLRCSAGTDECGTLSGVTALEGVASLSVRGAS
jgi:hypothetical protein